MSDNGTLWDALSAMTGVLTTGLELLHLFLP